MHPAMTQFREEVVNVVFAQLLSSYGLAADPETVQNTKLPDVLINMSGIKVILEGRFGSKAKLQDDAKRRVEDGLADIALALHYEPHLRVADNLDEVADNLAKTTFSGTIYYFHAEGIAAHSFTDLSLRDLVETLNSIFKLYVRNDILRAKIEQVHSAINGAVVDAAETGLFFQSEAVVDRLKVALGLD